MLRCLAGKPMVVFGDGTQTRDFTFVSDTAAGIIAAGLSNASIGQTINLGSGKEIQIRELAATITEVLGKTGAQRTHVEPHPGDVLRLLADSSKARELLGFIPTVSLRAGLAVLHDWYRSSGKSPEELLEQEVVRNWQPREIPTHA
jgi:UDP-glucose 4-epimerase